MPRETETISLVPWCFLLVDTSLPVTKSSCRFGLVGSWCRRTDSSEHDRCTQSLATRATSSSPHSGGLHFAIKTGIRLSLVRKSDPNSTATRFEPFEEDDRARSIKAELNVGTADPYFY